MNKTVLAVVLAAFAAGPVLAAGTSEQSSNMQMPTFEQLDTNHDGVISPDEAKAAPELEQNWQAADTNKDGSVDQSEFSAFEAKPAGQEENQQNQESK